MIAETMPRTAAPPAVKPPLFRPGLWRRMGFRVLLVFAYLAIGTPAGMFRAQADNMGMPVRSDFNGVESVLLTDLPNRWLQVDWLQFAALQNVAMLIYVSWFALPLIVTLPLLGAKTTNPWRIIVFVMLVYYAGMPFFALYPLEPPWMHNPDIANVIHSLRPEAVGVDPNPVASIPSLHVAMPAAAALWYGRERFYGRLLFVWSLLISVSIVYVGYHYVADIVAGYLLAGAVYLGVKYARLPLLYQVPPVPLRAPSTGAAEPASVPADAGREAA